MTAERHLGKAALMLVGGNPDIPPFRLLILAKTAEGAVGQGASFRRLLPPHHFLLAPTNFVCRSPTGI